MKSILWSNPELDRFKEATIPWLHCSEYQLHTPLYNGLPVKSGSKTMSYPLRSTTNELMGVKIEKHKNSQKMTTDSATTQDVQDFSCSKLLTFKTVDTRRGYNAEDCANNL